LVQGVRAGPLTFVLALLIVGLRPPSALAQAPERHDAFVYGVSFFNGQDYGSALVPPSIDTIYLLAGIKNVIAPRQTAIYFWPVTNRYLADWELRNELVEGTLDIYQAGRLFRSVRLVDYVIQYDLDNPSETLKLYNGEEAAAAYAGYQVLQNRNKADQAAYNQAEQVWRDKMDTLLRALAPGQTVTPEQLPEEPSPVPPFTLHSSSVEKGYVVSLPVGEYDVQTTLPDGSSQPDSRKHLLVFDKQQDGIEYSLVPSSRWNKPEESYEPGAVIYALPGTTLYLEPYNESLYNEYQYGHMVEPQDVVSRGDRGKWVTFDANKSPALNAVAGGEPAQVPLGSYYVQQIPGSGLGYEVVGFDPKTMQKASFQGYQIELSAGHPDFTVQVVDQKGAPLVGSERRVMALYTDRAWALYVLSGLPLLAGIGAILARRRSTQRIHVEE
jgi:hypothetical protein